MEPIPKGALLTVSAGCYSDYRVAGVFRALKEIDTATLIAEWLKAHPEQEKRYSFEEYKFLADLAKRGFLEDVECWELHLGDGTASEIDVSKFENASS